jgi:hypothetical protein
MEHAVIQAGSVPWLCVDLHTHHSGYSRESIDPETSFPFDPLAWLKVMWASTVVV